MNQGEFPAWFNPLKLRPIIVAVVFRLLQGYSQSTRDIVVDDALDDVRKSYRPMLEAALGRAPASPETFAYRIARARAIDVLRRGPADLAVSDEDEAIRAASVASVDDLLISADGAGALVEQVFTRLPHPPFQLVTFAAHRLADHSLTEVVAELASVPLGVLWHQLEGGLVASFASAYPFPDEVARLRRHFAAFRVRLARPVGEELDSAETVNLYRAHAADLLGRTAERSLLRDYFTVDGDAARRKQAGHWCEAVRRRSVAMFVRTAGGESNTGAARGLFARITSEQ